jgi:hypothetical protein
MLCRLEVPVAADDIIKHAATQTLSPNITASLESNRARIKRRSQERCKYLV